MKPPICRLCKQAHDLGEPHVFGRVGFTATTPSKVVPTVLPILPKTFVPKPKLTPIQVAQKFELRGHEPIPDATNIHATVIPNATKKRGRPKKVDTLTSTERSRKRREHVKLGHAH